MTSRIAGFTIAVFIHAAILLFGGIFFLHSKSDQAKAAKIENVDLVSEEKDPKEKDKKEEQADVDEAKKQAEAEEVHASEDVPDLKELAKLDAAAAAPALDAMSLDALEDALNPSDLVAGDGGAFSNSVSFSSGGRIGGTGRALEEEGSGDGGSFAIAELDQKPRAIMQPSPVYPWELNKKKIEGTVYVLFIVDETGRVVNPKVESTPHPGFEKAALDAVRQWKFEPAVRGGKKVSTRMRVPLRFSAGQS